MFALTTLVYPAALAAMCVGAGLLIDCASGGWLPGALLPALGAAGLIGLSQLTTYVPGIAPSTPYVMLAAALAGFVLARVRARELARAALRRPAPAIVAVLAYLAALAPVLLAGRPSFSSFQALADSAVHMMGADFLVRHGQHYSRLDLRNSYGRFIHFYYGTSYPSGADTLFGGSTRLLGLPLIWTFQPFNAFMLALGSGPAWLLARRLRLPRALAALAALTAVLPALVYAYELLGSVKEITALTMILTLGCLVALQRSWLAGRPARAVPFALATAAGVSALGVAFGAWALAAAAVPAVALVVSVADRRRALGGALAFVGAGALVLVVAAWPTWAQLSGSLRVAQNIASTGNSGNLQAPLRAVQVLGVWLHGSYKLSPGGGALAATDALVALVALAAALGLLQLLRVRAYALGAWIALMLLVWLIISHSATSWADAKTLVLTSPALVLLAWGGVATLRTLRVRALGAALGGALAISIAGGVLASDAFQYHSSNLAPTARYEELATIDSRFAGRGPALFTDFDEYSLYVLRDLDVAGPDFVYPPPTLASLAGGYGDPVQLDRAPQRALAAYPLIVTRRDPAASRPPSAYALLWQGHYYEVWGRRRRAPAALAHVRLVGAARVQCSRIGRLASADPGGARLLASPADTTLTVPLSSARHPRRWGRTRRGLVMSTPGTLDSSVVVPAAGWWRVWLRGELMPAVTLSVDGRRIATVAGQLSGNSLVPDAIGPFAVRLGAGAHALALARQGFTLAPGNGGAAILDEVFLTPAGDAPPLATVRASRWRTLCGPAYAWAELVPEAGLTAAA